MDILTEVVEALRLKATAAARVSLATPHREDIRVNQAVALIVTHGRCALTIDQHDREFLAGDYVLLTGAGKAVLQSASSAPANLLRCEFSLQSKLPHPLARQLPSMLTIASRNLTDETELGQTVALLDREIANGRFGTEFVTLRLAEIAFVEVLRRSQLEAVPQLGFLAALADTAVGASLALIHAERGKSWRVDELARSVGLSRAAFSERFHRLVGEPPLRYSRAWRMLGAHRELTRDGVSVGEVANSAGYQTANGFSRAFRAFFGYTPSTLGRRRA